MGETPPDNPETPESTQPPDLMADISKTGRKVDASHLQGQVNIMAKKQLEQIILKMLEPYVGVENRDLMGEIAQLELKLSGIRETNEGLDQEILQRQQEIAAIEAQHAKLLEQIEATREQYKQRRAELEARRAALEAEIEAIQGDRNKAAEQVEAVEAQLRQLEQEMARLEEIKATDDPQARIDAIEAEIERLNDLLSKLLPELDYFGPMDRYRDGLIEQVSGALQSRIQEFGGISDASSKAKAELDEFVTGAGDGVAASLKEIDLLMQQVEAGKGSVEVAADLVRLATKLSILRERLAFMENSLDLITA